MSRAQQRLLSQPFALMSLLHVRSIGIIQIAL